MPQTTLCPNTEIPGPHEHELLTSKKSVPYIRCDKILSHIYFKSEAAKKWLSSHVRNSNPTGETEGPGDDQEEGGTTEVVPDYKCRSCGARVVPDQTVCVDCGEEMIWE